MNMACVQSTAVNLFDEYSLLIPPKLKSCQDGPSGQRVMFITDQKENFNISFEEGMKARAVYTVEGRKKKNVIKLEEIEKISSLHRKENEDATVLIQNPLVFALLHRLL